MNHHEQRWDTDTTGHGIADGSAIAPSVERFLATLSTPWWVAEEPALHLLPHLERTCRTPGAPWRLVDAALDADAVYQVTLAWSHADGNLRQFRGEIFALIGSVAESKTYIHQRLATEDMVVYDVVTGMLDCDSPFRPYGHLMRLTAQRR